MFFTKLLACILIILVLAAGAFAGTTSQELYYLAGFHYDDARVKMLTPEEFFIMPWGMTPGNKQALKDIKDCGFNMAGFVAPEHVKLVNKTGLKCIVRDTAVFDVIGDINLSDDKVEKIVAAMTSKFKNNSAVYGYYIYDEPSPALFPNLARWAKAIRKTSPSSSVYINMLPGWGLEYENNYLEPYINTVHPAFISYDNYSLHDDGSAGQGFFMNLEAVRKLSLKHNIPFWNIILANSHFRYADVSQGSLNYQVYSTLAYGGKGISYFTYFAPFIGNYRNAAVNQFLKKTPVWDMIQFINLQIHQLGPTYLKLKSVNVFHTPNVPQYCSGMETSKHLSEISGGNFVVGEFTGPANQPVVIIVNKDIHKSTGFQFKFKEQGTVMMTSPYTGETRPFGGENSWLGPGCGVLLSLKK